MTPPAWGLCVHHSDGKKTPVFAQERAGLQAFGLVPYANGRYVNYVIYEDSA
jgi:hypothetical protein